MSESYSDEFLDIESQQKFQCQDVFFPKPLIKQSNIKRELFIDYGNPGNVFLHNEPGKPPTSQKHYDSPNELSSKHPTLPMAWTALEVDYPFTDKVMGENLHNIKNARNLCYYVNRIRGAWLSKIPFNHLKPLKRVITDMKKKHFNVAETLLTSATPILKKHFLNFQHLLTANVENYNSAYVGGCLTALETEPGQTTVCFPSGEKFNKLYVRELIPNEGDPCFYQYNSGVEIDIGQSIYEVGSTTIRDTSYCALRCGRSKCHLLKFHGEDFNNTLYTVETVDEKPTSICLSPYIEGESLIATDSGTVHIWRVGKGLNTAILNNSTRFQCHDPWRQVHYGACPQEIVVADRTVVEMFDRRTKCESSIDLFAIPNKILLSSERISVTCKHPVNPYQHIIATDYSLLVTDQRFPGHPVMYWNHILEKCPAILSVYDQEKHGFDSSLVLLASQYPAETCCFQFQQNSSEPVHSTQAPWRVSKISDIREFDCPMLNTYSLLSGKRLNTSLCGIAAVPGYDKQSLLTLQLDCHGELFYQVYSTNENNSGGDLTCSAGPGYSKNNFTPRAQTRARTWMSSLERNVGQFCELKNVLQFDIKDYSYKQRDLKETYPGRHALCPQCLPQVVDADAVVSESDDTCPSCNLTLASAEAINDSENEDKIADISCNAFDMLDAQIPLYDRLPHSSAHSSILIKLWKDDPDIAEDVRNADHEKERYRKRYKKQLKKLSKKAIKRKKLFKILQRHGHDLNAIYFEHHNDPIALDQYITELASKYVDEDEFEISKGNETLTTLTTVASKSTIASNRRANITRLLQDSHNLSQLQHLPSTSGSICSDRGSDFTDKSKSKKNRRRTESTSETASTISSNNPNKTPKQSPSKSDQQTPSNCSMNDGFKIPSSRAPRSRKRSTTSENSPGILSPPKVNNIRNNEETDTSRSETEGQNSHSSSRKLTEDPRKDQVEDQVEDQVDHQEDDRGNTVKPPTIDSAEDVKETKKKNKKNRRKKNTDDVGFESDNSVNSDVSITSLGSEVSLFSTPADEVFQVLEKYKKQKKIKKRKNRQDGGELTSAEQFFSDNEGLCAGDDAISLQENRRKTELESDSKRGQLGLVLDRIKPDLAKSVNKLTVDAVADGSVQLSDNPYSITLPEDGSNEKKKSKKKRVKTRHTTQNVTQSSEYPSNYQERNNDDAEKLHTSLQTISTTDNNVPSTDKPFTSSVSHMIQRMDTQSKVQKRKIVADGGDQFTTDKDSIYSDDEATGISKSPREKKRRRTESDASTVLQSDSESRTLDGNLDRVESYPEEVVINVTVESTQVDYEGSAPLSANHNNMTVPEADSDACNVKTNKKKQSKKKRVNRDNDNNDNAETLNTVHEIKPELASSFLQSVSTTDKRLTRSALQTIKYEDPVKLRDKSPQKTNTNTPRRVNSWSNNPSLKLESQPEQSVSTTAVPVIPGVVTRQSLKSTSDNMPWNENHEEDFDSKVPFPPSLSTPKLQHHPVLTSRPRSVKKKKIKTAIGF